MSKRPWYQRVTLGYVVKRRGAAPHTGGLYAAVMFGDDGKPFIAWGPRRRAARLSRYDARYMARANNHRIKEWDNGQPAVVVRLVRVVP